MLNWIDSLTTSWGQRWSWVPANTEATASTAPAWVAPVTALAVGAIQLTIGVVKPRIIWSPRSLSGSGPSLRRCSLARIDRVRRWILNTTHSPLALPNGRIRVHSLGRRSSCDVRSVVNFTDVCNWQLIPTILESLQNLLCCDFSAIAKNIRIIKQC